MGICNGEAAGRGALGSLVVGSDWDHCGFDDVQCAANTAWAFAAEQRRGADPLSVGVRIPSSLHCSLNIYFVKTHVHLLTPTFTTM